MLGTASWLLRPAADSAADGGCGGVFYTTYHERSVRRTVRGLLSKWQLRASVVPLEAFLPQAMLDDPQFASIKMITITYDHEAR